MFISVGPSSDRDDNHRGECWGLDAAVGGALKLRQFEVIVGGNTVPEKKPDPRVYKVALERMGLDPSEAIAIEDAWAG